MAKLKTVYDAIAELVQALPWNLEEANGPLYVELWERDEHGSVINKVCVPVDRVKSFCGISLIVELNAQQKVEIAHNYMHPVD